MAHSFGTVAIFFAVALLIPASMLALSGGFGRVLRTRRPHPAKDDTYESGMRTVGPTWVRFRVQYYLYALLFVLFDVEVLFIVPAAVAYRGLNQGYTFSVLGLFVGVLLLALGYAWRRGAFEWD